jgi:hypothetical protein
VDEAVLRAIDKWPDVPSAYGWLSLDRRGDWFVKGERITSRNVVDFIARNYAADAAGRWFFQNGPQRVFVTLDYTPYVLRVEPGAGHALALRAHTGQPVPGASAGWLDENGALLLECLASAAVVHDRDLLALLPLLCDATGAPLGDERLERWLRGEAMEVRLALAGGPVALGRIDSRSVPARFRFDQNPRPRAGEPEC